MKKLLSLLLCAALLFCTTGLYTVSAVAATSVTPAVEMQQTYFAALDDSGVVWTWKTDSNDVTSATTPTAVNDASELKFTAISTGTDHMLALSDDGKVYAWGSNAAGQLAANPETLAKSEAPRLVEGALREKTVVAIVASNCVSIALTADGALYSWGDYTNGLLGLENKNNGEYAIEPTQIEALRGVFISKIFASNTNIAAIAADGSVYFWGKNDKMQSGVDSSSPIVVPQAPNLPQGFLADSIVFGSTHASILCKDGRVSNIGLNNSHQFGNPNVDKSSTELNGMIGNTDTYTQNPTDVKFISIAAGNYHMLGLSDDGTVYAWGNLVDTLSGDPSLDDIYNAPIQVSGFDDIKIAAIDSYGKSCIAIDEYGLVYRWGEFYGEPTKVMRSGDQPLCLGSAPDEIVKSAYVTATAVVPSPTYTVSIPATLGATDLVQTASTANKTIPFEVSVANINNLFGEKEVQVSVRTASGSFVLQNEEGTHELIYKLYNSLTENNALDSGDVFAVFDESNTATVKGRLEIDQSQIVYTDEYLGTLIFDISLVSVGEEE